ncbi:hypothetical protein FH972_024305 [Carpinus fangiana]|uniref:Flavin-containing monooxygenase n=1 Tax=Carpinus fangiana TaxID=176857 RepID=A0A5N6KXN9_9ROSI|nr:hypothetical protein FH972_024305 [Carpinus fangiana]
MIQLETQVTLVEPILGDAPEQMKWTVHTTYLPTLTSSSATYDAVLIASGHYTVPRVPDINNIAAFVTRYKDNCSITHSKAYSSPEQFHGKKVLVVGGGPSAVDIAAQISTTCSKPLLISTRSPPTPAFILPSAQYVAEITSFLTDPQHNRAVRLLDGTILADLDAIVFCTGYIYAYPFLPTALPSAHPSTPPPFATHPLLHPDGTRVHALYKHLFYAPAPTLAFLTLPWNIVPFPVAEGQAAVVARVWAGRTALPPLAEMLAWERARVAERGDGKAFHRLAPPEDVEYVNELRRWSEEGADGGESTAPHWGVYMRALRFAVAKIKKAYGERGEQRREIMTLEELGVVYDEAKGEMRVGEDE